MLIKGIKKQGRRGIAIPVEPREAAADAVIRAAKLMNTLEWIFWPIKKTAVISTFRSAAVKDKKGQDIGWRAWAEGTVMMGKTRTKDDTFFKPRKHTFKVHYESCKDDFGIPDIRVAAKPELLEVERNPSQIVGLQPVNQIPQVITGELTPQPTKSRKQRSPKASEEQGKI